MTNKTSHTSAPCAMCLAIVTAVEAINASRKQEAGIPAILAAAGFTKAEKPWVAAKHALVQHEQSKFMTPEMKAQVAKLDKMDAELTELKRHASAAYEPNSRAFAKLQQLLSHNTGVFLRERDKLEAMKAQAGVNGTLAEAMKRIESKGFLDLLGLKASDLTAAIHAAKAAFNPVPNIKLELKKVTREDILAEYNLGKEDIGVADLIAYLRTIMAKPNVRVKRHSKPRKRAMIDEGALKEEIALRRPSIIINYATGSLTKVK